MAKARTNYTKEFKLAILSQVESGIPVAQVARENGLHSTLVFRWKKEFQENPEKAFSGAGHPYKEQARIAEYERTIGRLYAENEFLKKTLEKVNERVEEEKRKSQSRRNTK
jgi:transposase